MINKIKNISKWILFYLFLYKETEEIKNCVDNGIVDFSGEGRDKYGK